MLTQIIFLFSLFVTWSSATFSLTRDQSLNKTKRNLLDTSINYGERGPVYYATRPNDYFSSFKTPFGLPNNTPEGYQKQVNPHLIYPQQPQPNHPASQNYIQQQHVPQNPSHQQVPQNPPHQQQHLPQITSPQQQNSGQFAGSQPFNDPTNLENMADFNRGGGYAQSETVVSPVQHSALVHHGQNYAQVQFQPYLGHPNQYQPPQTVPKRIYQAPQVRYLSHHPQHFIQSNPSGYNPVHLNYQHQKPVVNYITHNNGNPGVHENYHHQGPAQPVKTFKQPTNLLPITKPSHAPKVHEQNEDEKDDQMEEDDEDEKSNYSEEDEHYDRYSSDDDDEDESSHEKYKDERDDDDDSERDYSKIVKYKHSPNKHNDRGPKKYKENYSDSYSYHYGSKDKYSSKNSKNKPDKKKKVTEKYKKKIAPKSSKIQARDTENIPVIQKNYFSEKWFLAKAKNNEKKQ